MSHPQAQSVTPGIPAAFPAPQPLTLPSETRTAPRSRSLRLQELEAALNFTAPAHVPKRARGEDEERRARSPERGARGTAGAHPQRRSMLAEGRPAGTSPRGPPASPLPRSGHRPARPMPAAAAAARGLPAHSPAARRRPRSSSAASARSAAAPAAPAASAAAAPAAARGLRRRGSSCGPAPRPHTAAASSRSPQPCRIPAALRRARTPARSARLPPAAPRPRAHPRPPRTAAPPGGRPRQAQEAPPPATSPARRRAAPAPRRRSGSGGAQVMAGRRRRGREAAESPVNSFAFGAGCGWRLPGVGERAARLCTAVSRAQRAAGGAGLLVSGARPAPRRPGPSERSWAGSPRCQKPTDLLLV